MVGLGQDCWVDLMRRVCEVVEYTRMHVTINFKLTNLKSNQELDSIMVNYGRIYRELGNFLGILQIQSNWMIN